MAELTDQVYAQGRHILHWDAGGNSSGVYFYRLESDGRLIHARKMTLVK